MADEKISALPAAGTLDGTEPVPIVKGGATKQTTTQAIADLVAAGNANITTITVAGLQALQAGSTISTTTLYVVTDAVGSTLQLMIYAIANNTNVVPATDIVSGAVGTYDITDDVFTGATSSTYIVITKTDYETAYTGGLLVTGTKYRITDAIDTGIFATPNEIDAVVLATSGSTIFEIAEYPEIQGFGKSENIIPGGSYGALITFNGIPFTISQAAIIYAAGNVGGMFERFAKITFLTDIGGVVTLTVTDDGTYLITNNVYNGYLTGATSAFGNYDLATGVFTANMQIISFKKELLAADVLTGGYFQIDEMGAITGGAWEILSANAKISGITTPYDDGQILIISASSPSPQYNDGGLVIKSLTDTFNLIEREGSLTTSSLEENAKMFVQIINTPTVGDGIITVYGTARLITV